MRKLLLVSIIFTGYIGSVFAARYECEVQELKWNQFKRSNEYLFPTYADYNDSNGRAFVCGHQSVYGCDSGTKIMISGEHYWQNIRYSNTEVYQCSTSGANAWSQTNTSNLSNCSSTDGKTKITTMGEYDYYGDKCTKTEGTGMYCVGVCRVKNTESAPAPTPSQPQQPTPVTPLPTPAPAPNPTQNCINSRTSAEGKACCLVPSSVAKWDGQHCICTDSNKTFINGSCVSQQQSTTVTFTCPQAELVQLYSWLEQYASNAQIVALINQILEFCTNDDNRSQIEFNRMMAELRALIAQTQANIAQAECNLIPGANWIGGKCVCVAAGKVLDESQMKCVDSAETVAARLNAALQKSRNEISSASSKINAIKESFKKTVWKDEDGKFNTSRLASDSIAAVVLGTTGALVTSNVIKKNQVKNGFEDINCTVGGQKVAAWGDEFRVGIQ